jgi:hypothetical protein
LRNHTCTNETGWSDISRGVFKLQDGGDR